LSLRRLIGATAKSGARLVQAQAREQVGVPRIQRLHLRRHARRHGAAARQHAPAARVQLARRAFEVVARCT
jgi:hypothetical protein